MNSLNSDLETWVNPSILELYRNNLTEFTAKCLIKTPYPAVVIKDFLKEDVYLDVLNHCRALTQQEPVLHYGRIVKPLNIVPLVRFLYSKDFLAFLSAVCSKPPLIRKTDEIPTYRIFPPKTAGIEIHNDAGIDDQVIGILHMNDAWDENFGGEFLMWERTQQEADQFVLKKKVPPTRNTLFLLPLTKESYHSVSAMDGDWQRESVCFLVHEKSKNS